MTSDSAELRVTKKRKSRKSRSRSSNLNTVSTSEEEHAESSDEEPVSQIENALEEHSTKPSDVNAAIVQPVAVENEETAKNNIDNVVHNPSERHDETPSDTDANSQSEQCNKTPIEVQENGVENHDSVVRERVEPVCHIESTKTTDLEQTKCNGHVEPKDQDEVPIDTLEQLVEAHHTFNEIEGADADMSDDNSRPKFNLKPDAKEFIPRMYNYVEAVPIDPHMQYLPPNFIPMSFVNHLGEPQMHPAFIPQAIPINFLPPDAKFLNIIPNHAIPNKNYTEQEPMTPTMMEGAEPQAEQTYPSNGHPEPSNNTKEPETSTIVQEEVQQVKISQSYAAKTNNRIDIDRIVSKLEEAAKEQRINESKRPVKQSGKPQRNGSINKSRYQKQNGYQHSKKVENESNDISATNYSDKLKNKADASCITKEIAQETPVLAHTPTKTVESVIENAQLEIKNVETHLNVENITQNDVNNKIKTNINTNTNSPNRSMKYNGKYTQNMENGTQMSNGHYVKYNKFSQNSPVKQANNVYNGNYKANGKPFNGKYEQRFNGHLKPNENAFKNANCKKYQRVHSQTNLGNSDEPMKKVELNRSKSLNRDLMVNNTVSVDQWMSVSNRKRRKNKVAYDDVSEAAESTIDERDLKDISFNIDDMNDVELRAFVDAQKAVFEELYNKNVKENNTIESKTEEVTKTNDIVEDLPKKPEETVNTQINSKDEIVDELKIELASQNTVSTELKLEPCIVNNVEECANTMESTSNEDNSTNKKLLTQAVKTNNKKAQKSSGKRVIITDSQLNLTPEVPKSPLKKEVPIKNVANCKDVQKKPKQNSEMEKVQGEEKVPTVEKIVDKTSKSKTKKKKKSTTVEPEVVEVKKESSLSTDSTSYDFLLGTSLMEDEKTNLEMSEELDKMIRRGMYSTIEDKVRGMQIDVSDDKFFKTINMFETAYKQMVPDSPSTLKTGQYRPSLTAGTQLLSPALIPPKMQSSFGSLKKPSNTMESPSTSRRGNANSTDLEDEVDEIIAEAVQAATDQEDGGKLTKEVQTTLFDSTLHKFNGSPITDVVDTSLPCEIDTEKKGLLTGTGHTDEEFVPNDINSDPRNVYDTKSSQEDLLQDDTVVEVCKNLEVSVDGGSFQTEGSETGGLGALQGCECVKTIEGCEKNETVNFLGDSDNKSDTDEFGDFTCERPVFEHFGIGVAAGFDSARQNNQAGISENEIIKNAQSGNLQDVTELKTDQAITNENTGMEQCQNSIGNGEENTNTSEEKFDEIITLDEYKQKVDETLDRYENDGGKKYPLTEAVKEWMVKTREKTPEIEILKSPNMIYKEFLEEETDSEDEDTSVGSYVATKLKTLKEELSKAVLDNDDEITLFSRFSSSRSCTRGPSEEPTVIEGLDSNKKANLDCSDGEDIEKTVVDQGEDVIANYESMYGKNEDFLKIKAEVEEQCKEVPLPPTNGNLPYKAICCNLM